MSFDRREFLRSAGKTACAAGIVSVVANCGEAEGDDDKKNDDTNLAGATIPNFSTQLKAIAAYYGKGGYDYISDLQEQGTVYDNKIYTNTGHSFGAEAVTSGSIDVIQGLYLDPTDNHTPSDIDVTDGEGGAKTVSWKIYNHNMGPLGDDHHINAFDLWVAGASAPVKLDVTQDVDGQKDVGLEYSLELTAEQVGDADFAYLVSHCNRHGGRIAVFGL